MDWNSPSTKKHIKEAEAQGCRLLRAGRNTNYRFYELPCGHNQQVTIVWMRRGRFECKTCLEEKLNREALERGCMQIGAGDRKSYRLYKLPCGHDQQVHTTVMRHGRGKFKCKTCLVEKLDREANEQECKLISSAKKKSYCLYTLPCGHEKEVHTSAMRKGNFRCPVCPCK